MADPCPLPRPAAGKSCCRAASASRHRPGLGSISGFRSGSERNAPSKCSRRLRDGGHACVPPSNGSDGCGEVGDWGSRRRIIFERLFGSWRLSAHFFKRGGRGPSGLHCWWESAYRHFRDCSLSICVAERIIIVVVKQEQGKQYQHGTISSSVN